MPSPVATPVHGPGGDDTPAAPALATSDSDPSPLLTNPGRDQHRMTNRASDGEGGASGVPEEEGPAPRLRWPVRHNSASSDPVTRERRMRRLGTFVDKAKERGTSYRVPLRTPADGGPIRRIRTAPVPVRRRSSAAVSPMLFWFTRPLSSHSGGESLLRRVGHHIRARSYQDRDQPGQASSEESLASHLSAPEISADSPSSSTSELQLRGSPAAEGVPHRHHHHHCVPALNLLSNRRDSLQADSPTSLFSTSPSSGRSSMKSVPADTATTLADVHVVKVSPRREKDGRLARASSSDRDTPSPSIHVVESGHGAYEIFWDEQEPWHFDRTGDEAVPASSDPSNFEDDLARSSSCAGLARVNSKLNEWSYAARESTALDRSRSHPHFRSYVEVYQDADEADEPQFHLDDDDNSNAIFMAEAPPNSKHPTPRSSNWPSRRASEAESIPSPSTSSSSSSKSPSSEDQYEEPLSTSRRVEPYGELIIPSGYYSPRPNKPLSEANRLNPQSRSLSNLSDETNPNPLLTHHRDSVILLREHYPTPTNAPVLDLYGHRDSITIARDRIRKKHMAESTGGRPGMVIGGGGSRAKTAPLAIPRVQQVAFVGGLSPIADSSPPNREEKGVRRIDELAGEA